MISDAVVRVTSKDDSTAIDNLPSSGCRCIYTLYLMSDSYLGLDQQYDIHLNVTPPSIAAQVNTEVSDSV